MEDFRSKSCVDGRMVMEAYEGRGIDPDGLHDLRCYTAATYVPPPPPPPPQHSQKEVKGGVKKGKGGWGLSDPELQRKKRVASYKAYAVEGRMKGSFRQSFRWLKDRYTQVVYGWW